MEAKNLPLEVKLKVARVLDTLTEEQVDWDLVETRIGELIGTYDSKTFRHYRESFLKLAIANKNENNSIGERNKFILNYSLIGNAIDTLRPINICGVKSNNLTDLVLVVGQIYTGLEVMSIHTDELDKAYLH